MILRKRESENTDPSCESGFAPFFTSSSFFAVLGTKSGKIGGKIGAKIGGKLGGRKVTKRASRAMR